MHFVMMELPRLVFLYGAFASTAFVESVVSTVSARASFLANAAGLYCVADGCCDTHAAMTIERVESTVFDSKNLGHIKTRTC